MSTDVYGIKRLGNTLQPESQLAVNHLAGLLGTESGPLEEQNALFTAEPALQFQQISKSSK